MAEQVHGDVAAGYGAVADEFRRNFTERRELGAAMAVVRHGELVVDLWGGHRDRKRTTPWERQTLVTVWSTTKGMAATAMAVAHSRGHTGSGGSFAFADPETGTGYAYVMNRAGYSLPADPRELALRRALETVG
ncbi:MAG: serine hydrolase [Actinomycetota bacterium]